MGKLYDAVQNIQFVAQKSAELNIIGSCADMLFREAGQRFAAHDDAVAQAIRVVADEFRNREQELMQVYGNLHKGAATASWLLVQEVDSKILIGSENDITLKSEVTDDQSA